MGGALVALRFGVLGPLQVTGPEGPLPVSGPRQLALLAVLLLAGGRVLSRDRLIDELWGDDPPPTAVNALQVHVAALRRALGGRIRTAGSGYALDAVPGEVDADRFERLLDQARPVADHARRAALLTEALALWRGQALSDVPRTPSVAAAASRLEELRLGAIEDRAEAELTGGRHVALVAELRELVSAHPDRERLAGQLMLALHRSGRSAEALDAYRELAATLDRRLGVDPSDALAALERAIRRADPTLAAPLPVSLPAPASRFIGRRRELAETADLLVRSRLLTLVGPGGCGKTRLAIELAAREVADHPDGVHFVDLAAVASTASVAHAAAAALGVRQAPGETLEAALSATLRRRRVLVVLDNCEHVAAAAASLCRTLLEACPGLRVLATGRQPLGLAGETVWRVPGLAPPDAVGLLADRASSVLPGHELGARDEALAEAVCLRLDALPLAIELVAGRLAVLSLAEIADHLDRRLALLASAGPAPRRRHQTMRAAIDWSHDLLEPGERAVLRRLAVFAGSFGLAAAEAVAADPDREPPYAGDEVLPLLLRLADKSMVAAHRVAAGTRYRLLETIRVYGLERLEEAGEAAAARGRHARWYGELAAATNPAAGATPVAELDQELASVRAALGWCLGAGAAPDLALAIAAPLWWYWWVAGVSDEGRSWLLRCLAAARTPTAARALGLRAAAALARNCGDNEAALRLGEECLAAYRALDDRLGVAAALNGLCITASHLPDHETALRYAAASLEQARATGSANGVAASANNLGTVLRCLGRLGEAEEAHQEALAGFLGLGNLRGVGSALNNLALEAIQMGDGARARRLAQESLASYHEIGLAEGELDALVTVAMLEVSEGRPDRALLLLSVVGRERRRLGIAAPTWDEAHTYRFALDAAVAGLDEPRRAAALAEAERTGLAAVIAVHLEGRLGPSP